VAKLITSTAQPLPTFALWEVWTGYLDALAAVCHVPAPRVPLQCP